MSGVAVELAEVKQFVSIYLGDEVIMHGNTKIGQVLIQRWKRYRLVMTQQEVKKFTAFIFSRNYDS